MPIAQCLLHVGACVRFAFGPTSGRADCVASVIPEQPAWALQLLIGQAPDQQPGAEASARFTAAGRISCVAPVPRFSAIKGGNQKEQPSTSQRVECIAFWRSQQLGLPKDNCTFA